MMKRLHRHHHSTLYDHPHRIERCSNPRESLSAMRRAGEPWTHAPSPFRPSVYQDYPRSGAQTARAITWERDLDLGEVERERFSPRSPPRFSPRSPASTQEFKYRDPPLTAREEPELPPIQWRVSSLKGGMTRKARKSWKGLQRIRTKSMLQNIDKSLICGAKKGDLLLSPKQSLGSPDWANQVQNTPEQDRRGRLGSIWLAKKVANKVTHKYAHECS